MLWKQTKKSNRRAIRRLVGDTDRHPEGHIEASELSWSLSRISDIHAIVQTVRAFTGWISYVPVAVMMHSDEGT